MFVPPARSKLSQQIFDAILEHVLTEDLQPGDALPSIGDLSARFQTSRPIVREALSGLEAVGLLEITSGRNATIREIDGHLITLFLTQALRTQPQPMSALMDIRGPLEVQCAALAAQRADAAQLDAIEARLAEMESALQDGDEYPLLDVAFHLEIARAAGNTALMWVTESLRRQLVEVMIRVRGYREQNQIIGPEQDAHRQIAAAIRRGDSAAAALHMREHMAESGRLVAAVETLAE